MRLAPILGGIGEQVHWFIPAFTRPLPLITFCLKKRKEKEVDNRKMKMLKN